MARSTASKPARVVVRPGDPERDRPRWGLLSTIGALALALGVLGPRACGLRFGSETPEEAAAGHAEPPAEAPAPAPAETSPATESGHDGPEAPALARVTVGKSTLLQCQDPPAAELKPSRCGEHGLDPHLVPRLEQLASCPAAANVQAKLALTIDLHLTGSTAKVVAAKGSSAQRNDKRDPKAIEPLLQCVRAALGGMFTGGSAPSAEHARYVLSYPVTITALTPPADPKAASPAPTDAGKAEKVATGVATVQVDTAIVRDAPNTNGQPIGRLSRGTRVSILGTAGNWFHVRFGDGDAQDGWIFRTNIGR